MFAVPRAARENPPHPAAIPVVAHAWYQNRRPEHVLAPDRFAWDTAPRASQIVRPQPAVHGSAASLHRCPRELSSSPPPRARSAQAWPSKRVRRLHGVPPASSACIPIAPHAAPSPPNEQWRCRRTHLLPFPQDPVPKRLTSCSWYISSTSRGNDPTPYLAVSATSPRPLRRLQP